MYLSNTKNVRMKMVCFFSGTPCESWKKLEYMMPWYDIEISSKHSQEKEDKK